MCSVKHLDIYIVLQLSYAPALKLEIRHRRCPLKVCVDIRQNKNKRIKTKTIMIKTNKSLE